MDSPFVCLLISLWPMTAGADCALSFRFGGDLAECASSLAAAAALVSEFGGIAYFPDDDLVYTLEGLSREIEECLAALDGEP